MTNKKENSNTILGNLKPVDFDGIDRNIMQLQQSDQTALRGVEKASTSLKSALGIAFSGYLSWLLVQYYNKKVLQ